MAMFGVRIWWFLATMTLVGCAASAPPPPPAQPTAPAVAPEGAKAPSTSAAPLKAPGEASVGDRTTCPISGEEFTVTATSPKQEYKGKTYYFCCGGCDTKFAKEPEKYLSKKSGT